MVGVAVFEIVGLSEAGIGVRVKIGSGWVVETAGIVCEGYGVTTSPSMGVAVAIVFVVDWTQAVSRKINENIHVLDRFLQYIQSPSAILVY
jgi:hypothetical protein